LEEGILQTYHLFLKGGNYVKEFKT
jgi:hypothetical protein